MSGYRFLDFANWGSLEQDLRNRFMANATWPLDRAGLAALTDLGMSDAAIADFFAIEAHDVAELRRAYRL